MSASQRILGALVALLACSGPISAQKPDLTGVEIVVRKAGGSVYMLEATGDVAGNIAASVGPDGILIVDDQWAELTEQISEALRELNSGELRFIINTHHHDDHSDGNADLGADGALIVAHERARERLLAKDSAHWPVITFDSALSVHFNGEEVRALAIPGGHTDNDVAVFFTGSNVVHLGDLFNSGTSSFPVVDFEAGGDAIKTLENVEHLLELVPHDAAVIAGHGPLSDKEELGRLRDMLEESIGFVRERRAEGRSLEEIVNEGLGAEYDDWGWGYMPESGWLEAIWKSLEQRDRKGDEE